MPHANALPLSEPEIETLFVALNEEILRLQEELGRFHELAPAYRLASPEQYREQIRVRRELLCLLGCSELEHQDVNG